MTQTAQTLDRVRGIDRTLKTLVSGSQGRYSAVKSAADAFLEAELKNKLEQIDVEELNHYKLKIRTSALKNAGIDNIYAVLNMGYRGLTRLPGIGEKSAATVMGAAKRIRTICEAENTIRIDPSDTSEETRALLRASFEYVRLSAAAKRASVLLSGEHENVMRAYKKASSGSRPIRMFFSTSSQKKETSDALELIEKSLNGAYGEEAAAIIEYERKILNYSDDAVRLDFEKNAAAYYSTIESIVGASVNSATESGITAELSIEIEAENPDITGLKCTLRHYQLFGLKYILHRKNVLLGDEMGLGKTVQAIAAMQALKNQGEDRFMVVCPASVLVNWCREIAQHSDIKVTPIHKNITTALNAWVRSGGAAVTTYETISKFSLPEGLRLSLFVADEAHYVKNPGALRTGAMLRLQKNADRSLFMTGTPIENNVDEMCWLLSVLNKEVSDRVSSMKELRKADIFRETIAPVYLRRTRDDVLTELPEKIESIEYCTMSSAEKEKYRRDVYDGQFMSMRRVSWNADNIKDSSKAQRLLELCDTAKEQGRRVIVFSFFLSTLERAVEVLGSDRCFGPVTGAVAPAKRQEIIDSFSESAPGSALVCQIQAGGTGLNIQAASVVIICEPQLKPSIENQAISRAYRMGQVNSVLVYRLICENSVDERIMEILDEKQNVFDSFADKSASGIASLNITQSAAADEIIRRELKRIEEEKEDSV